MVLAELDAGFALPGLPGDDPVGHPDRAGNDQQQRRQPVGCRCRTAGQRLERHHDQRVPRQHREALAERAMDRRLTAAQRRIVETGQVVVDQGRAMQQLDRSRRGVGRRPDGRRRKPRATDWQSLGRMRAPPGNTA